MRGSERQGSRVLGQALWYSPLARALENAEGASGAWVPQAPDRALGGVCAPPGALPGQVSAPAGDDPLRGGSWQTAASGRLSGPAPAFRPARGLRRDTALENERKRFAPPASRPAPPCQAGMARGADHVGGAPRWEEFPLLTPLRAARWPRAVSRAGGGNTIHPPHGCTCQNVSASGIPSRSGAGHRFFPWCPGKNRHPACPPAAALTTVRPFGPAARLTSRTACLPADGGWDVSHEGKRFDQES